ncbi:hypothetical protein QZH41_015932, partial [Actinostola sp. cb2023]
NQLDPLSTLFAGATHFHHLERLQNDLFSNYSKNIIPQKHKNIPIKIKFDIALNQIIDLDERLQTISTIVWVRLYWVDFRLRWNRTDYGGIKSFVTSSSTLWTPDITLYNNANDNYDKEKEEYYGLTVNDDGRIGWFYPTIFKSSCTIDVTYFPFDDQTVESWSSRIPQDGRVVYRMTVESWSSRIPQDGRVVYRMTVESWSSRIPQDGRVVYRMTVESWSSRIPHDGRVVVESYTARQSSRGRVVYRARRSSRGRVVYRKTVESWSSRIPQDSRVVVESYTARQSSRGRVVYRKTIESWSSRIPQDSRVVVESYTARQSSRGRVVYRKTVESWSSRIPQDGRNKRAQTMKSVIWVRQYWEDSRLTWNASEYDDVTTIVTEASRIWLPDITLYNNARDDYKMQKETRHSLSISSDGSIARFFPTIYKSSCRMNVRNFPFDDQTCVLKLGSWSYDIFDVNLTNVGNGDLGSFILNGEWILQSMPAERHETMFRCCPNSYVYVLYHINIRRRSLYYLINCFTPCLIMLALTLLGFYLPSESGERMGVGITVLLSLSIIQLMLSDTLPPNEEIPLIVRYYGLTMFNVFLSLVFTCMVLKLYHNKGRPLPTWIKRLLCNWGAWLVRLQGEWKQLQENRETMESKFKKAHLLCDSVACLPPKYNEVTWNQNGDTISSTVTSSTKNLPGKSINHASSKRFEKFLVTQHHNEIIEALLRDEWRFASKVLNNIFKLTIGVSVFVHSIVVFAEAPMDNLFDWLPK